MSEVALQRVVFALSDHPEVQPLYLDAADWSALPEASDERTRYARARGNPVQDTARAFRVGPDYGGEYVTGRRSLRLPAGRSVSLATYFSAFPAAYWRRSTSVRRIRLRVETSGRGRITVLRSNARAVVQTVEVVTVDGAATATVVDLALDHFLDGGWYWFDLQADDEGLELLAADWLPAARTGIEVSRAAVSITTLNKVGYCLDVLRALADEPLLEAYVSRIQVIDQGSDRLAEAPGFADVRARLGDRLRLIEQGNIGGSGGFARGMQEAVDDPASKAVILLDDDVVLDPESIIRLVTFASLCDRPTIVGGHMFDMYDRTRLHALAETIDEDTFFWGPVTPGRHDLAAANLRQTPWLHQRHDAVYNGWWMCLIPTSIIEEIGLALPVFIKWDDAEYGLRARAAGYDTVSLPGAAIWHVSWVDKDDSRDWQAFYHARNRLVAALLHSSAPRGGLLIRSNLAADLRYLLTLDYSTVALRLAAYESVLAGPSELHAELGTRLGRIRALAAQHDETSAVDDALLRTVRSPRAPVGAVERPIDSGPSTRALPAWLATRMLRHALRRPRPEALAAPQAHLAFAEARWWVVPDYDSVLRSNADGRTSSRHTRDPRLFRTMLARSVRANALLRLRWPRLVRGYRAALPELTSARAWRATFERASAKDPSAT